MKTFDDIIKNHGTWQEDNDGNTVCCISLPELNQLAINLVEFAQRWIDISDEMPEVGRQILTKNGDNIGLSLPLTMWDIKDITEFATQWRPIELK